MKKTLFYLYAVSTMVLTACVSNSPMKSNLDYTNTFKAPYTDVWRAVQQTLLNYPMNINNMEIGHLQTLYITGKQRYQAPHKRKPLPPGYQYRLDIHLIKGKKKTKVLVSKNVRLQQDFFSEPKDLSSDGFEERAFLYRVQRELLIEKILKKKRKKEKKQK